MVDRNYWPNEIRHTIYSYFSLSGAVKKLAILSKVERKRLENSPIVRKGKILRLNCGHFATYLTSEAKVKEFLQNSFYIKLSERINMRTDTDEVISDVSISNLETYLLSGLPRRFYGKIKVRDAFEKMVENLAGLSNPDFRLEFLEAVCEINSLEQAQFCF